MNKKLRVVVATAFSPELAEVITKIEPRIELVFDPELLPPMRHPADFSGDPSFSRSPKQQHALALYGIPDQNPSSLARTVRANPLLRWVHTMAAGGGAQVREAGLSEQELDRVAFSTSAGVHAEPLAEFAIFGLLAGAKNLVRLQQQQRERSWTRRWMMGQLSTETVLVLGLGAAKFSPKNF